MHIMRERMVQAPSDNAAIIQHNAAGGLGIVGHGVATGGLETSGRFATPPKLRRDRCACGGVCRGGAMHAGGPAGGGGGAAMGPVGLGQEDS